MLSANFKQFQTSTFVIGVLSILVGLFLVFESFRCQSLWLMLFSLFWLLISAQLLYGWHKRKRNFYKLFIFANVSYFQVVLFKNLFYGHRTFLNALTYFNQTVLDSLVSVLLALGDLLNVPLLPQMWLALRSTKYLLWLVGIGVLLSCFAGLSVFGIVPGYGRLRIYQWSQSGERKRCFCLSFCGFELVTCI